MHRRLSYLFKAGTQYLPFMSASQKMLHRAGPPPDEDGGQSFLKGAAVEQQPQQESDRSASGKIAEKVLDTKAEPSLVVPAEKDATEKDAIGKS